MGRQWLHAKRAIVNLKKGQTVGKLVKEIAVAAKLGGAYKQTLIARSALRQRLLCDDKDVKLTGGK